MTRDKIISLAVETGIAIQDELVAVIAEPPTWNQMEDFYHAAQAEAFEAAAVKCEQMEVRYKMLLTDEEIMAAGYSSGDPDGVLEFGKNVIVAHEAKLREQEPVAVVVDSDSLESVISPALAVGTELFTHPAPIPGELEAAYKRGRHDAVVGLIGNEPLGEPFASVLHENLWDLYEGNPAPIPEGYALVPVEPTDAMLEAAWALNLDIEGIRQHCTNRYKELLAAARSGE